MTVWITASPVMAVARLACGAVPTLCLLAVALLLGGCTSEAPIVVEQVAKEAIAAAPVAQPVVRSERMLAAIIPHGETAIFFKVTGPESTVAREKDGFLEIVRSVKFENDTPQWTLPEGWTQDAGDDRELLATVTIPVEPPLEMTVTSLPMRGDEREYRLMNVNRWRGQMGLRPMAADQLHAGGDLNEETVEIPLEDGTKATLVNIAGQFFSGRMMPPSAGGASAAPAATPERSPQSQTGPTYQVPNGWDDKGAQGISVATFTVGELRTTVIPLAAEANGIPPNINRWREQVGLPALDESEVDATLETITLGDGQDGKFVQLVAPESSESQQALLGVIAYRGDVAWFVKMMGETDAVLAETANFKSFVSSLRFTPGEQ